MNFTLNPGQEFVVRAAVDWFLNSDEQLFQYDGPPGSGKSVVLNEIVKRLGLNINTEIAPMSFIGAASLVMRTKGLLTAKTAHSWIYEVYQVPLKDPTNGRIIYKASGEPYYEYRYKPRKTLGKAIKLIIIDEAYCMPRAMRPEIEKFGVKILACGDQNQLPPVKDKPAFLVDGKIYHLTQVMRQIGIEDIVFIANRAMLGLPLLNGYYGHSMVLEREDVSDALLLWADVIICGTNRTRDKINKHIRHLRHFTGLLPNYGERVVCRNNNWDLTVQDNFGNDISLVNGLIGTVSNQPGIDSFSTKNNTFTMKFIPDLANCEFVCDANYDYMISDSDMRPAIKKDISEAGQMFEFAYAITCHISQGSQFHKVIYIEETLGGGIQSCLNLVGATRADQQLVYVKNNFQPWPDYYDPDEKPNLANYNNRISRIKDKQEKNKNIYNGYKKTKNW